MSIFSNPKTNKNPNSKLPTVFFLLENYFKMIVNAVQNLSWFSVAVGAMETDGYHLKTGWAVAKKDVTLNDLEGRVVKVALLNRENLAHVVSVMWIYVVAGE